MSDKVKRYNIYILTEILWLMYIFDILVADIKIFDGFVIKHNNIQTMTKLTFSRVIVSVTFYSMSSLGSEHSTVSSQPKQKLK